MSGETRSNLLVKIAYLILAHDTPNHLPRLVHALDSSKATFFIHIDRKSDIAPFQERLHQSNVIFLEERLPVYWGEFSQIQATINLVAHALHQPPACDYLVLLSGSDYPLRGPAYIEAFFSKNHGRQFINSVPMPCKRVNKPLERLQHFRFQTPYNSDLVRRAVARLNHLVNEQCEFKRDYLKGLRGLKPHAGSQWWALTNNACRYILEFIESRPDVVKFYRNVSVPDESFFQTILANSQFALSVVRNVTFTVWPPGSARPAYIGMSDLCALMQTERIVADDNYGRGELLFARKFPDDSFALTEFINLYIIQRSIRMPLDRSREDDFLGH